MLPPLFHPSGLQTNVIRHSSKHLLHGVFLSLHLVKLFTPVSGRWNPECERAYAWSDDFSFLVIQLESTCGEIKSHSCSDSQVQKESCFLDDLPVSNHNIHSLRPMTLVFTTGPWLGGPRIAECTCITWDLRSAMVEIGGVENVKKRWVCKLHFSWFPLRKWCVSKNILYIYIYVHINVYVSIFIYTHAYSIPIFKFGQGPNCRLGPEILGF